MLVSLSISNFRSFAGEETFSLVASKRLSGTHDDHLIRIPDSEESVLRCAVLYGANGAGKSNLLKALRYAEMFVLRARGKKSSGTGREPFRFGGESNAPSTFDLQFIAAETLYHFGFSVDDEHVTEEWLAYTARGREKTLYERTTDANGKVAIDAPGLKNAGQKLEAMVTVGGPPNQSFLATVSATLDREELGEHIHNVIAWFEDLALIGPEQPLAPIGAMLSDDPEFLNFAGKFLKSSSTGVDHLRVDKITMSEDELRSLLPRELYSRIVDDAPEGGVRLQLGEGSELFIEPKGESYRLSVQAAHQCNNGSVVPLDMAEESDGTQRLLNLLPALYFAQNSSGVYFIDEIDRSMHPVLVRKLFEFFLKNCTGEKRQIIVTTHESNLLDLDLLRRDEIWFVEKDQSARTHLYSLTDFKVRKDLQIRKGYLEGRFGGIPFLGELDALSHDARSE
jgi:predicted ATPase